MIGALLAAGALSVVIVFVTRGPHIVIPDDACATPPPLRTWHAVTLQPLAMTAFKKASALSGGSIEVVQSYRSCAEQRAACMRLCSNANGCPNACARPGTSYHQLGAAIDISSDAFRDPRVVSALQQSGWCEPLPTTDPLHFSYDGCH